jgi:hypothetical protein
MAALVFLQAGMKRQRSKVEWRSSQSILQAALDGGLPYQEAKY